MPVACDAGPGLEAQIQYFKNFEFINAAVCPYENVTGFLTFGVIVWSAIVLSIYTRQASVIIPTILLILTGGVVMSTVAGPVVAMAGLVVLTAPPGTVAYAIYKYSR